MRQTKRIVITSVAVVLCIILLEGLCSFIWLVPDYFLNRREMPTAIQFMEEFHAKHDPQIGWVNIAGKRIENFYGPGRHITINNQGFRGLEDYLHSKPQERFRVICLGDSFTLGYGVDDNDTYSAQLVRINPTVQAVNMGQGGYSLGQSYLWYQRNGSRLSADCLVLALILDDIWRMTGGRMANGAAMPSFQLRDGKLHVSGQPVPSKIKTGERIVTDGYVVNFLIKRNALFRTVASFTGHVRDKSISERRGHQLRVALAILEEIHRQATAQGTPLVLMLMPEIHELTEQHRREIYSMAADDIRRFAVQRSIPFLDLYAAFPQSAQLPDYYLEEQWQHYSELGNRLVAEQLNAFLAETFPSYPIVGKR